MKTFEQLAQEAHTIYVQERIEQDSEGLSTVDWKDVTEIQRRSWIAATRHIVEQANQVH